MNRGIGVHVRAGDVRAVVVETDGVGVRVVVDAVESTDGEADEIGALVRLAGRVGAAGIVPAHLAWDTGPVTATDATGLEPVALDALFHRRARAGDDAVVIVGDHDRRVALTLAWDAARSTALTASARRAGLATGSCEPAAVAARRVSSGDAALGAALVAAGLAPAPTVHALRTPVRQSGPRPWVVEPVVDAPVARPPSRPWWRRRAWSFGGSGRPRQRQGGSSLAR